MVVLIVPTEPNRKSEELNSSKISLVDVFLRDKHNDSFVLGRQGLKFPRKFV